MFNLYNIIFEILIWKVISVYFLWFDYWTLKECEKLQKYSFCLSILTITQMIGPNKF